MIFLLNFTTLAFQFCKIFVPLLYKIVHLTNKCFQLYQNLENFAYGISYIINKIFVLQYLLQKNNRSSLNRNSSKARNSQKLSAYD